MVELIQDYVLDGVTLELQHDSHAFSVALVAEVRDPLAFLRLDQEGNRLDERGLADHVRDFRDDDPGAVVARFLTLRLRPTPDEPPSGPICLRDSVPAAKA